MESSDTLFKRVKASTTGDKELDTFARFTTYLHLRIANEGEYALITGKERLKEFQRVAIAGLPKNSYLGKVFVKDIKRGFSDHGLDMKKEGDIQELAKIHLKEMTIIVSRVAETYLNEET